MTLRDRIPKLARALLEACKEHGQPNTFSPGWLWHENRGPSPRFQGLIAKNESLRLELVGELARIGWKGTMPIYDPKAREWVV